MTKLSGTIFSFDKVNSPHDARQTTTNRVIFVPERPRFAWHKHEAWTSELIGPHTHGLVQAIHVARGKRIVHV